MNGFGIEGAEGKSEMCGLVVVNGIGIVLVVYFNFSGGGGG